LPGGTCEGSNQVWVKDAGLLMNPTMIPWSEKMKGQLSAEMLVLVVVVFSIVAIAAIQLVGTAKQTGANIQNQTERLGNMTSEAIKSSEGGYCIDDSDCRDGLPCRNYICGGAELN
jgi:hypothetical protein